MRKRILSMLLALLLYTGMIISVCAEETLVFDQADLLSASEESELSGKLREISKTYQTQIVVATVAAVDDGDVEQYLNRMYDELGLGYSQSHDGALLLVCMDPRECRILCNGIAHRAIGSSGIEEILDVIVPNLSDGEYADAFLNFADECETYLDGHINGYPFYAGKKLTVCLIIGLVIGLIVVLILWGQLKSVRKQNQAHTYMKPGSMHLNVCSDIFLYRNVVRTKKESSSAHGGGSSRSTGGRSF